MDPDRQKYLEFIQAVITRMATNEFTLRTWSVGLATAITGFAATSSTNFRAAYIAAVSALIFWFLDCYYLALEQAYRDLYNLERVSNAKPPSFDLAVTVTSAHRAAAFMRPAVYLVHGPVFIFAIVVGSKVWP